MLARRSSKYDERMKKKKATKAKKTAKRAPKAKPRARRKPIMRHSKEG
jgi:hypothetical protein